MGTSGSLIERSRIGLGYQGEKQAHFLTSCDRSASLSALYCSTIVVSRACPAAATTAATTASAAAATTTTTTT
jgi:hypothetical protein